MNTPPQIAMTENIRKYPEFTLDLISIGLLLIYWAIFIIISPTRLSESIVDDTYIFQRVVENLWEGRGWTYNSDSYVNPITSPFYAFVLFAAKAFHVEVTRTISSVYILGLIVLCITVYLGMRKSHGIIQSWIMAALISSSFVLTHSWGMETSIFLACIALSVLSYVQQRYVLAGILCACSALSRPEGLALVGILAGTHLLKDRRLLWGMILVFIAILTPWLIFSWFTYGHILPNSVSVKAIQHNIGWFKTQPTWAILFLNQPHTPWLTYPLAALGLVRAIQIYMKGYRFLLLIIIFGIVQFSAYSLMNAPPGYLWYLAPGNMSLDIAVILGAFYIGEKASQRLNKGMLERLSRPSMTIAIFLVALLTLSRLTTAPVSLVKPYRLSKEYTLAGEWIRLNTPENSVVAATEIGYIGYFSKRQIRDIHGLIHPEALNSLKNEEWDWWFKSKPPEVIVTHSPPWPGEPSENAGWKAENLHKFKTQYQLMVSFGTVDIYQRIPSTTP